MSLENPTPSERAESARFGMLFLRSQMRFVIPYLAETGRTFKEVEVDIAEAYCRGLATSIHTGTITLEGVVAQITRDLVALQMLGVPSTATVAKVADMAGLDVPPGELSAEDKAVAEELEALRKSYEAEQGDGEVSA